ncbi:MAG: hypothetical protein ACUVQH_12625 [Thermogutta sp.]
MNLARIPGNKRLELLDQRNCAIFRGNNDVKNRDMRRRMVTFQPFGVRQLAVALLWSAAACCRYPLAIACYRFLFSTDYRRFTVQRIMGDSKLSPY